MKLLHVVFGTGPLGLAVMHELRRQGKPVRMVNRSGRLNFDKDPQTELGGIDASDLRQSREVCEGAHAVYHCVGLPYAHWHRLPAIALGIVEGAASAGARLIYADNLYLYGAVGSGPMKESLPAQANTPKGMLRAQIAKAMLSAHANGRVRVTIGRGSDFFGPYATTNAAMGARVFGRILEGKAAQMLGKPDVLHSYTFVHDFGRALVKLADRDDAFGLAWHVPTAPALTSRRFVELVGEAAGSPAGLQAVGRPLVNVLGLFSNPMREIREVLWHFERDYVMDSSRFEAAFGMQPTSIADAIARTLEWFRAQKTNPGRNTAR